MDAFPAFIPLRGARVVVVGVGEGADAKARLFDGSPAQIVRLPVATADGLAGATLVFVALDDEGEAAEAARVARAAGAIVNVVDRPGLGDFATPSIVDRGRVVGAVGTGGAAPVLAVRLRQEIEARWPAELGAVALLFEAMRGPARAILPTMDLRRRFFRELDGGGAARLALGGATEVAIEAAQAELETFVARPPRVGRLGVLVAPPDLEALTLRALRRLGAADRLLIVGDPPAELLGFARRDAPRGREVDDDTLAEWRAAGDDVVVVVAARLASDGLLVWEKRGAETLT